MLLSLILPVYNVEAYLGKCLDSCIDQNLSTSDYEIILVIDGSTDHSIDVAKSFQAKHENIKILFQENQGQSTARNNGLKHATGEYIWFIDSDDYIPQNILSEILTQLKSNELDILYFDWREISENGKEIPPFAPHLHSRDSSVMQGTSFMEKVLNNYLYTCCFAYSRTFLTKNNLFFTDGMYYEDTDFSLRCLPKAKRVKLYNKICYNYLQHGGSTVHSTNFKKLQGMAKNCVTTTLALNTCDGSLKRFYKICFTSFYMLFLKEVLKSKNKEYADYLIQQTEEHNFGKVSMFGNSKTKAIGAIYNIFGVKTCLRIIKNFI